MGEWAKSILIKMLGYLYNFIQKIGRWAARHFKGEGVGPEPEEELPEGNPFLPKLRVILEHILDQYGRDYRLSFWKGQCYEYISKSAGAAQVKWVDGSPLG